jgi:hypothetical protein
MEENKEKHNKIIGGLQWPEEGSPAFLCLLTERKQNKTESLEPQIEYLDILKEYEGQTISDLVEQIDEDINVIYAPKDRKFTTFIRDFNIWRREKSVGVQLRPAVSSSFESGILRIKDFIKSNKLRFPEKSVVREQLKIFSKLSFKSQCDFYAVAALSHAVSAIRTRTQENEEVEPDMDSWY